MKLYLRVLSYARPYRRYLPQYLLCIIGTVIFNTANLTFLIPLLNVLFSTDTSSYFLSAKPEFSWSVHYFQDIFHYTMYSIIKDYGKFGALQFVCGIIFVSVFLTNLFRYFSSIVLAKIQALVIKNLRTHLYKNILSFPLSYFANQRKGDIIARVTSDVSAVEYCVVNTFRTIFKEPATIISYFITLFLISSSLTLIVLLLIPASALLVSHIGKSLRKEAAKGQEALSGMNVVLDESLGAIRIVKAFNADDFIFKKFIDEIKFYANKTIAVVKRSDLVSPISEFMGVSTVLLIVLVGGNFILKDTSFMSPAAFIGFLVIFSQILGPMKTISHSFTSIQVGLAAAERVFQIIDTKPSMADTPNAIPLHFFEKSIEFQNVSFGYNANLVLKDISFTLEKGKTVALVGISGGGKSTISDLIPRFYDVSEGKILIDDNPLMHYTIHSVREQMGIVNQESILFHDTIFNNIAFGMKNATKEQVEHAAKIANAHDFIMQTEHQYNTYIGDRGIKLSGGQKQRISIARAVLKNPSILILDEATSALDSESEKLVQEALSNLMKNRTSLVIAHRLSTIQNADDILVIQEGQIIERGTHQELMAKNGYYCKLIQMQTL